MRVSISLLALAAAVALGGCGDDEPEQADIPRPAPTQRVRPDTTVGDTGAARPGGGAEPGQQAGRTGEDGTGPPGGEPGGVGGPGAPGGGQAGAGEAGAAGAGETAGGRRLYTVQVAAFTSPDSAQKWAGRLSSLDLPVWMSMAELRGTTYYRVRVGAVPTFTEARELGSLMTGRFEWPVWIAPVTPSDRMPPDAVAATRRVLGGS